MTKEYVDKFLKTGSIRIGSLQRYINMENSQSDLIRGDEGEGKSRTYIHSFDSELRSSQDTPPDLVRLMKTLCGGWEFGSPGFELEKVEFHTNSNNLLALCLSSSLSFRLAAHFGVDSCLIILDPNRFVSEISRCLEIYQYVGLLHCTYMPDRQFNDRDFQAGRSGGFVKDSLKICADNMPMWREKEVRAVWRHNQGDLDHLDIDCPNAIQFCKDFQFR
jgi:hypothetical protein